LCFFFCFVSFSFSFFLFMCTGLVRGHML
jgi:hypothetical protein